MANSGRDDNSSQFFFTLGPTQELQGKHTIFGKVTGNTVYNMLKLAEVDIGENDRPVDPHKITRSKILHNPFDDILPRQMQKSHVSIEVKKKKSTAKATKNFSLLSFGDEAEEDEEETNKVSQKLRDNSKDGSKSSHDLLEDDTLSTIHAVDQALLKEDARKRNAVEDPDDELDAVKDRIRKKLRTDGTSKDFLVDEGSSEDENKLKSDKIIQLKKEAKKLKKELLAKDKPKIEEPIKGSDDEVEGDNELVNEYKAERRKYKEQKKALKKKGSKRENDTLAMLSSFQSKLTSLAEFGDADEKDGEKEEEENEEEDDGDISWMNHKLTFEAHDKKVIDANVSQYNRYEIFDPRNPVTQRRREKSKQYLKQGKKFNNDT